jgi:hypothetical protein
MNFNEKSVLKFIIQRVRSREIYSDLHLVNEEEGLTEDEMAEMTGNLVLYLLHGETIH